MSADTRLLAWLFAAFACLYLLTSGGHFYSSDDVQKLAALDAWFRTGSVAFPDGWAVGRGGLHYSWHALGTSLLMLPGYLVGRAAGAAVPFLPGAFVERFAISLQNAFFTAALATLVAAYARWLGQSARAAVFAAICFGLGTMAWPYAKGAASEPGATLCLFGACFALHAAMRRGLPTGLVLLAGTLVAAAVSIRLELAAVIPGVLAWLVWRSRQTPVLLAKTLALLALPVGAAAAAALGYNVVRYGTIANFQNYQMVQDSLQLPPGGRPVWALLNMWHYTLNPADGLFWFSPAIMLGVLGGRRFWLAQREAATVQACALVPLFLFYTCVWGLSDWAWGLRYGYMFLPFLVLPAAVLWDLMPARRAAWLAVACLGVAVQLLALPQNFNYLFERFRAGHGDISIQTMMATPADSPLLMALEATPATLAGAAALLSAPRPIAPLPVATYRTKAQFVPDQWAWLMLLTPLSRWAIAAALAGLLGALTVTIRRIVAALNFT